MGFVPDAGSWRNIQLEAARFIMRHQAHLEGQAPALIRMVQPGKPPLARTLAGHPCQVPGAELYDHFGAPIMVPLGKAFFLEAAPNWTGEFVFDPKNVTLANDYVLADGATDG
jgi:hypothetical protein